MEGSSSARSGSSAVISAIISAHSPERIISPSQLPRLIFSPSLTGCAADEPRPVHTVRPSVTLPMRRLARSRWRCKLASKPPSLPDAIFLGPRPSALGPRLTPFAPDGGGFAARE